MAQANETKSEAQFQRESAALDWMPAIGGRGARVFVTAEAAGGTSHDVAELGLDRPDLANRFARLFAASGDLREALKDLLPWAEGNHDGAKTCDCDRCEVVRAARVALAKAEG